MKNISEALRASVSAEKEHIQKKNVDIEDRFLKAQFIFDAQEKKKFLKDTSVIKYAFTFPEEEYHLIEKCKERMLILGHAINKSEIVRLGLLCLDRLTDEELDKIRRLIQKVKTGRPRAKKGSI